MGASNLTPLIGLPQFGDNDKPTWRGDINSAFQIIDEVLGGKADKATLDYYVADYNGVGDGVTDDTVHIQNAINDAAAHGGGIVHLMRGRTHLINGEIFVKTNVLLTGGVGNFNGSAGANNTPAIKFGSVNSRIRVGAFPGRFGSVNGENPNGLAYMLIDANHQGPVADNDGSIYIQGTGILCQAVHIKDAAGNGAYFDAAQNSQFNSFDVQHSGKAGICLDNGSGGLIFTRCEIADNKTGILSTDNQSMPNAYPYGTAHCIFEHCIVENYVPVDIEVDIQAGVVSFHSCGFSNNMGDTQPTSGTLIKISNPIYTGISSFGEFDSCIFVSEAGESLLTIQGNNVFYMYGRTHLQGSFDAAVHTTAFIQDGGIGLGKIDGEVYQLEIDKFIDEKNGGTVFNWFTTKSSPTEYLVDPDLNTFAIFIRALGEAGIRAAIGSDGSYNFYTGADFTQKASFSLKPLESDPTKLRILYYSPDGHVIQGPVEFDDTIQFDDQVHMEAELTVDGASLLKGNVTMGDVDHPTEVKGDFTVDGDTTHTGTTVHTGNVQNDDTLIQNGLLAVNAGVIESVPITYAPAPPAAYNIDCHNVSHAFILLLGTGGVTGLNITNSVDSQKLRITYDVQDLTVNPRLAFWPAGATPGAGKTLPTEFTAVGLYSIEFFQLAGNWFESGRNF